MIISVFTSPMWYDDAGHTLVVNALNETGEWCYPWSQPGNSTGEINGCATHSPFITMGPALTFPAAAVVKILGGFYTLRLLIVCFSLLFLWIFFQTAAAVTNRQKAFWALLLVVGNIQFVVYGAEFLGELPMLAGYFMGIYALLKILDNKSLFLHIALAVVGFSFAVFTKEYILAVIGAALLGGLLLAGIQRKKQPALAFAGVGVLLLIVYLGVNGIMYGGWANWIQVLEEKRSYANEFLNPNWGESLPFLLKKPVIWLGAIALLYKISLKKHPNDLLLGMFWGIQLIFFLLSEGYDRMGFQLYFIPAIYLAEFIAFGWEWFGKKVTGKSLKRAALVMGLIFISWQQTPLHLFGKITGVGPGSYNSGNQIEKEIAKWLQSSKIDRITTFDQQLLPFLPREMGYITTQIVPSNAKNCQTLTPIPQKSALIIGEYGRTEYPHCWNKAGLNLVKTIGKSPRHYEIYLPTN